MTNSGHRAEVVRVEKIAKHPNADTLDIIEVWGFPVVVKSGQYVEGSLACFIPPDSVVDSGRPEFSFLQGPAGPRKERIRTRRFRGQLSMGMLVPVLDGNPGDDLAPLLGVEHYVPPPPKQSRSGGPQRPPSPPPPGVYAPDYDLEHYRRYSGQVLEEGELLWVTEKIHGSNARYVTSPVDNLFYAGSHHTWKGNETQEHYDNKWWAAINGTPVPQFCHDNPGTVVYGEIFGPGVQSLTYGVSADRSPEFAAFDIRNADGSFLPPAEFFDTCDSAGIPTVPFLGNLHWDPNDGSNEVVLGLAEGPTEVNGGPHVREGCVIKPDVERIDGRIGRVALKCVGAGYYEAT